MKPWLDEAAKTDTQTVKEWFDFFVNRLVPTKVLPFQAFYIQGEYYVVAMDEAAKAKGISPGQKVVSINGTPVHEFVTVRRNLTSIPGTWQTAKWPTLT